MHHHEPCAASSTAASSCWEKGKKWSCEYCTYENWVTASRCIMCRATHPSKVIGENDAAACAPNNGQPGPTAQLTADIYRLGGNSNKNRSRGTSPSPSSDCDWQPPPGSKWPCALCTYLNWPRAQKCVQCLTVRKKRVSPNASNAAAAAAISPRASPPASLTYYNTAASLPSVPTTAIDNLRISNLSHQDSNNERNAALASLKRVNPVLSSSLAIVDSSSTSSSQCSSATSSGGCKWSCAICTYENWPRSKSCVLCGTRQQNPDPDSRQMTRSTPSPPAASTVAASEDVADCAPVTESNSDYERRLRQLRRRMREADWTWLTACMGVVEGDMNPVEAYLNSGGNPTRKLTNPEVALLNRASIYETGHTLVHLAIKFHREDMLAKLLSQFESGGSSANGIKCVPSYVAPDLASAIRRHISQSLRQRKGSFPCYYIAEWATYSLPPEIEDLPPGTQEQLYSELLDRDAQKELEADDPVINWSEEIRSRLGSRLHALWNRSAGDCLLDSVLQATWGVFDRDNALRKAMSDSLHEAGHVFYPRWKEWEISQALELDFTLHDSQLTDDWTGLLNLASQPGQSLEQVHIFCLAHVLRRPIIVYGVKYVKSWRGENLGYARFEGVYLPLLWDPSFCSRSPIALGYTRGHFCALVPPEPTQLSPHSCAAGAAANSAADKSTFLPLVTSEEKTLLPLHFLSAAEAGREEELLREWLDVGVTDSGVLVARQKVGKPPLLVAQMTEEWLNHYRKLAQSSISPFNPRGSCCPTMTATSSHSMHMTSGGGANVVSSTSGLTSGISSLAGEGSAGNSNVASALASSNNLGYSSDGDSDEE